MPTCYIRKKCPHGRQKNYCKECGGSSVCPHGRQKKQCKDCGGSSFCEHGRRKADCKGCGGTSICPHGQRKSTCKECGGYSICPHGRRQTRCKDCGGSSICPHGRRKEVCKDCGGSSICPHGRRKEVCKDCGGSSICPHGRRKESCKECSTTEQILSRNIICHGCCDVYLSKQRKRNKITVCAECDPRVPQRTEKIVVPLLLSQITHPASAQDDTLFGGGECDASRRRPDLLWLYTDRVVTLEIDEHSHRDRTTSCELGKMHDQFVAWQTLLGGVPVFYIRFNPDEYDGQRTLLDDRVSAVAQRVNELLTMDVTVCSSLVPYVEFFYYHSNAQHHVEGVRDAPDSFVLLRR